MANKSNDLFILGVNNFANSEASASLLRIPRNNDGYMDYVCIGEDRLTRLKHTYLFPLRSIDYCLKHFGLKSLDEIDYIATDYARIPRWHNSGPGYRKLEHDYLKIMLRFPRNRIIVVDHHKCHLGSCYYPSGFDEAGVLIVDGMGSELMTQSAYHLKGNQILWQEKGYDWGIGRVYSFVSKDVLPYGPEKGYGKVMGLAAYGQSEKNQVLDFQAKEVGMTTDYSAFHSRNPVPRLQATDIPQCTNRQDVMNPPFPRASLDVQEECERQLVRFANYIHEKTGVRRLCISGGVALNGRGNYKILKETPIEEIWIQPGCSDTGISFGAALWAYYQVIDGTEKCRVSMRHAYCGSPYAQKEIDQTLSRYNIRSRQISPREIAQLLADKKIVAYFEGGSEFGPRALGHRSILADPRDPGMKDRLNSSVKFREGYRPYAPVVLLEDVSEYFDLDCESPFMLLVADVRKDKYETIPSVTHVDGTARVQTVTKEDNGNYYEIVRALKDISGVPVLINTSFNVNREPIVETPVDALICAFGTSIDYLVFKDRLIDCKNYRDPELVRRLEADRKEELDSLYKELTKKFLYHHEKEEMTRFFDEENKIADWHREYRSKYELEKAMAEWMNKGSRILIVGTRLHTKCLYLYISDFPLLKVCGFVPMDNLPGERDDFDNVYPEWDLDTIDWTTVDAVLVSSHEYQRKISDTLTSHPQGGLKPRLEIYDSAGDSLIYILPQKWPIMNPLEIMRHNLILQPIQKRTASNIDFDFEPSPIEIGERYGVWIAYHDVCLSTSNGNFNLNYGLSPETLALQVRTLKENFSFANSSQLVDPKAKLSESVVNLTFDFGLKAVMTHSLPVLEKYQVPATVFICSLPYLDERILAEHKVQLLTDRLGVKNFQKQFYSLLKEKISEIKRDPFDYAKNQTYANDSADIRDFKLDLHYLLPYETVWPILDHLFGNTFSRQTEKEAIQKIYLSRDDLKRLADHGIEIGIHNHDYRILCRLDYDTQKKNVKECLDFVSGLTGQKEFTVAYPKGFSNNHTKRVLKDLGILCGFSLDEKMITPQDIKARWNIPRYPIDRCFDLLTGKINHAVFSSLSTGD